MTLSHEPSKYKLYYLAHPLFSFGDPFENRIDSGKIDTQLMEMMVWTINPLLTIPPTTPEPVAMEKCDCLLSACDGIILCIGYKNSKGCRHEQEFAEKLGLEIIEVIE